VPEYEDLLLPVPEYDSVCANPELLPGLLFLRVGRKPTQRRLDMACVEDELAGAPRAPRFGTRRRARLVVCRVERARLPAIRTLTILARDELAHRCEPRDRFEILVSPCLSPAGPVVSGVLAVVGTGRTRRPEVDRVADFRVARDLTFAPTGALAREAVSRDGSEALCAVLGGRGAFGGGGRVLDAAWLHRSFLAKGGTSDALESTPHVNHGTTLSPRPAWSS
jgi:hypothetical protein